MNETNLNNAINIIDLRIKALHLYKHSLLTKHLEKQQEIEHIEKQLTLLLRSLNSYNFINCISSGDTLLVGEGNLSFTYALLNKTKHTPSITASTYEDYSKLSELGKHNVKLLQTMGVKTYHQIDATKLNNIWGSNSFNNIIFQFPNVGSRDPAKGRNPNYILVRDFIDSALKILKSNGAIIITTVDNEYYNNIFKFEEIAKLYPFKTSIKYAFNPNDYPEYQHTNTHEEESAIEDYKKFSTWEFKL